MTNLFKFILSAQFKSFGINKKNSGFTLIELLVGLILAVLIITPLMGLMIDILNTDRREQAKTTTEQEIQAALDFIERDLQQAIYIYDNDGLTRNWNNTPASGSTVPVSGIKNQIPPEKPAPNCNANNATNCKPILVFWKREFLNRSVGVSSTTDSVQDDGFAYSLVAYYLITNPNPGTTSIWSPSARISRFQIRGKVSAANATTTKGAVKDAGFNPPPIALTIPGATLKEKMNQWQAVPSENYTQRVETLVDFISTSGPSLSTTPCSSPKLTGDSASGFYACVNASEVLAQVNLRGNAYVRLENSNNVSYSESNSSYFPSASIQVQGRGYLYTK